MEIVVINKENIKKDKKYLRYGDACLSKPNNTNMDAVKKRIKNQILAPPSNDELGNKKNNNVRNLKRISFFTINLII